MIISFKMLTWFGTSILWITSINNYPSRKNLIFICSKYLHNCVFFRQKLGYTVANPSHPSTHPPTRTLPYSRNDGNYAQFYMPYSGNTGFYYVRNNQRTQYFINHFLVSGDLITATSTHQAPFLSVLSEHASLHDLKVKILPGDDFPGGAHYQRQRDYMKYLLKVKPLPDGKKPIDPWIFHMSWTVNKLTKLQFFQQMGEWYVNDVCMPEQTGSYNMTGIPKERIRQHCCAAKPLLSCHYRYVEMRFLLSVCVWVCLGPLS
jgi:hypothetical protein